MKSHRVLFLVLTMSIAAVAFGGEAPPAKWGAIPMSFEPNLGQTDPNIRFMARGNGYGLFFTDTEATVAFTKPKQSVVRMKLVGQSPEATVEGVDAQSGVSHYFLGRNPQGWEGAVPHFGKLRYGAVYPGIDLIYRGNQQQLEYDFNVAPGANPKLIEIEFTGADALSISDQGDLVLQTEVGDVRHRRPLAFQEKDGAVKSV